MDGQYSSQLFKSGESETLCSPTHNKAGKCAITEARDGSKYDISTLSIYLENYEFTPGQNEGIRTIEEATIEKSRIFEKSAEGFLD